MQQWLCGCSVCSCSPIVQKPHLSASPTGIIWASSFYSPPPTTTTCWLVTPSLKQQFNGPLSIAALLCLTSPRFAFHVFPFGASPLLFFPLQLSLRSFKKNRRQGSSLSPYANGPGKAILGWRLVTRVSRRHFVVWGSKSRSHSHLPGPDRWVAEK